MSVNLLQIVRAVQTRSVSLTAETAGYLLLAIADAGGLEGCRTAEEMLLLENGEFRLAAVKECDLIAADRALRSLLGQLIALCSAPHPPLQEVAHAEQAVGFAQSLLAALIPVNRSAARRALARTCRETQRALRAGKLDDLQPAHAQLDLQVAQPSPKPSSPKQLASNQPSLNQPSPKPSSLKRPAKPDLDSVEAQDWVPAEAGSDATELPELQVEHTVRIDQLRIAASSGTLEEGQAHAAIQEYQRLVDQPSVASLDLQSHTPFLGSVQTALQDDGVVLSDDGITVCDAVVQELEATADPEVIAEPEAVAAPEAIVEPEIVIQEQGVIAQAMAQEPEIQVEEQDGLMQIFAPEQQERVLSQQAEAQVHEQQEPLWQPAVAPISSWPSAPLRSESVVASEYAVARPSTVANFSLVIEEQPRGPIFMEQGELLVDAPAPPDGIMESAPDGIMESERAPIVAARPALKAVLYEPRRSDIGALLEKFRNDAVDSRDVSRELKQMVGIEASGSSQTPPPVGFTDIEQVVPAQLNADRGLADRAFGRAAGVGLAGLAALCVAWFAVRSSLVYETPRAASRSDQCVASIKVVNAPSNAEIRVRSPAPDNKFSPLAARGGEALFPHLPCGAHLEVMIRDLDKPEGAWSVIPVTPDELQAQTEMFPLEVSAVTR